MGYDDLRIIQAIERLLQVRDDRGLERHRCLGLINVLELQVEEDDVPPDAQVLRLLTDALLAQARLFGADDERLRVQVKKLLTHVARR